LRTDQPTLLIALEEGKRLHRAQRYDDAIAAFEAGFEIKPLPRLLFNIGRCHEKLGDLPQAIESFDRDLKVAETEEDVEDAETAIGIVRAKSRKSRSKVVIDSNPAGARLEIESSSGQGCTRAGCRDGAKCDICFDGSAVAGDC
jgi:tetratricopeptide (TPR) repeat protein